jgi:hypothetical protein
MLRVTCCHSNNSFRILMKCDGFVTVDFFNPLFYSVKADCKPAAVIVASSGHNKGSSWTCSRQ